MDRPLHTKFEGALYHVMTFGSLAFIERMMAHVAAIDLSPDTTRGTRPAQSLESIVSSSWNRNEAIRET